MNRIDIFDYAKKKYGTEPECLWARWPEYAVLRHSDNRKWYAVVMRVSKKRLGLGGDGDIDIIDVKCDPMDVCFFSRQSGFLPGYHMNKRSWLTILLDSSAPDEQILDFIDASYDLTTSAGALN